MGHTHGMFGRFIMFIFEIIAWKRTRNDSKFNGQLKRVAIVYSVRDCVCASLSVLFITNGHLLLKMTYLFEIKSKTAEIKWYNTGHWAPKWGEWTGGWTPGTGPIMK